VIIAKYQMLYKMLLNFSFSNDQQVTAVKYAVKGISHTQNDVRVPSYDCMGELYRIMGGDDISKYYEGLRPAQLDALMAKFGEIDDASGAPTKQAKKVVPQKQEVIETNIGGRGRKKSPPKKASAPAQKQVRHQ